MKLATSIAKPYKKAGYKTVFVTAGSGSWKNLGNYLLKQDFDMVVDQNTIKQWFPNTEIQTWGAFDEWGFKAVEKILLESKQPVFVVFLSITNHPPFSIPKHYQPYPLNLQEPQKEILKGFPDPKAALLSFQYANDALGKFMTNIKKSKIGNKTILAFTGDHNARSIAQVNAQNKAYYYGVPFLISIPKSYQHNLHYDKLRVGSHKDIAPTLYNLSLSNTRYINLGKSMLGKENLPHEFGINTKALINKQGLYDPITIQQSAWQKNNLYLNKQQQNQPEKTYALFLALENWLLHWQLNNK